MGMEWEAGTCAYVSVRTGGAALSSFVRFLAIALRQSRHSTLQGTMQRSVVAGPRGCKPCDATTGYMRHTLGAAAARAPGR
jgi:hypothetical protein